MRKKDKHLIGPVLSWVIRLTLACVWMCSGMTKAIDPRGTAYKLEEYGRYLHLDFLTVHEEIMVLCSISLCSLEFVLGIYLFWGIRRKFAAWLSLLLASCFFLVSFWNLTFHVVADCGCFGDAIHMNEMQTFMKNVVLLMLAVHFYLFGKNTKRLLPVSSHWLVSLYSILFIFCFSLVSYRYLPLIDFRPYKIGTDLQQAVLSSPYSDSEEETVFVMKKNGEEKRFTLSEYPDSTWTFVRRESVTAHPYIHQYADFSVNDTLNNDVTARLLKDTAYHFLLISPDLNQADNVHLDDINEVNDYCTDHRYKFSIITASNKQDIQQWLGFSGMACSVMWADGTLLKTIVRSNPGMVLMKNGKILAKWSCNNLPETEDNTDIRLLMQSREKSTSQLLKILLYYFIPLIFITFVVQLFKRHPIKHNKKMRKKIVAGNWKMNTTLQEGISLAKEINASLEADKPNCEVVVCTPFIHLASVAGVLNADLVKLGAENCADKEKGAYTGEVSAAMVKSTGAEYVILGHSERRAYYGETAEILKEKVNLALANGLKIIFCIGEVLEEREADKQNEVVGAQIEGSLFDLTVEQLKDVVLAYEPVWAIGTGKTATAEQAEEMHAFIRETIAAKFGAEAAENISILYGGSCKPSNAKEIFSKPNVDGGLIGGAALKADSFKGIIDAWK